MRKVVLAALLLLASGIGCAAQSVPDRIGFFEQHALLSSDDELKRCVVAFAAVASGDPGEANVRMKAEHCFDDYTGFVSPSMESPPNTTAQTRVVGNIFDVRIAYFGRHTGESLVSEVAKLTPEEIKGIEVVVFDLRRDPGGSVSGAIGVLESVSPGPGIKYLHAESRCGSIGEYRTTAGTGVLANKRYIFLVDGGTASASELVIGTIRFEWYPNAAIVVGVNESHTFGKSLIQVTSEDDRFRVTCAKWFVSGKYPLLPGIGIQADKVIQKPECEWDAACIAKTLDISRTVSDASARRQ